MIDLIIICIAFLIIVLPVVVIVPLQILIEGGRKMKKLIGLIVFILVWPVVVFGGGYITASSASPDIRVIAEAPNGETFELGTIPIVSESSTVKIDETYEKDDWTIIFDTLGLWINQQGFAVQVSDFFVVARKMNSGVTISVEQMESSGAMVISTSIYNDNNSWFGKKEKLEKVKSELQTMNVGSTLFEGNYKKLPEIFILKKIIYPDNLTQTTFIEMFWQVVNARNRTVDIIDKF